VSVFFATARGFFVAKPRTDLIADLLRDAARLVIASESPQ
jgi:hypothetical protein